LRQSAQSIEHRAWSKRPKAQGARHKVKEGEFRSQEPGVRIQNSAESPSSASNDFNGFNDFDDVNDLNDLNPPASPERLAMAGRRFEQRTTDKQVRISS
jgi:hypothetical protein